MSQVSAEYSELLNLLNSPIGLSSEDFADALSIIREMTVEELTKFYATDASQGSLGNVENLIIRGVIEGRLRDSGVELASISALDAYDLKPVTLGADTYQVCVVSPDKTTRAREDILFKENDLPNIDGFYVRRVSGGAKKSEPMYLSCRVEGICFTDRIGLPMFLSSFLVSIRYTDAKSHGLNRWIKKPKDPVVDPETDKLREEIIVPIPISEKSFRTDEAGWSRLMKAIETLSAKHYKGQPTCLRDFFYDCLKPENQSKMLFSHPSLDPTLTEMRQRTLLYEATQDAKNAEAKRRADRNENSSFRMR